MMDYYLAPRLAPNGSGAGLSATAAGIAAAADNEPEEANRRMRTAPLRAPVLSVRWLSAPEGADRQGEDAVVDAERAGAGMQDGSGDEALFELVA